MDEYVYEIEEVSFLSMCVICISKRGKSTSSFLNLCEYPLGTPEIDCLTDMSQF